MLTVKPRKTLADYLALPEESGHELLYGELLMSPAPTPRHQDVVMNILEPLRKFVRERRIGKVFVAPLDVVLAEDIVVQPDILYISNDRASILTEKRVQGAPTLVVEVVSSSNADRDKFVKKDIYARAGVQEYWIVDVEARTVEVWRLGASEFEFAALYERHEQLSSSLLPGCRLELSHVFA